MTILCGIYNYFTLFIGKQSQRKPFRFISWNDWKWLFLAQLYFKIILPGSIPIATLFIVCLEETASILSVWIISLSKIKQFSVGQMTIKNINYNLAVKLGHMTKFWPVRCKQTYFPIASRSSFMKWQGSILSSSHIVPFYILSVVIFNLDHEDERSHHLDGGAVKWIELGSLRASWSRDGI